MYTYYSNIFILSSTTNLSTSSRDPSESPALDMSVDLPPAGNVVDDAARYTISIKESVHSEHISIEGSV